MHLLAFSQSSDSLKAPLALTAHANLQFTNNGLSLFPNFALGKPAIIVNLSVGKKGIYFEPELRWGLNGKPWSYIYWLRYKYNKSEKFGLNLGAHPAYIVRETEIQTNGVTELRYVMQRYVAAEIAPTYNFSHKFQLGIYALFGKRIGDYGIKKNQFFSIQPKFPHIGLNKKYYLSFYPQFFYLKIEENKGTYFSESLILSKKNLPINLSSVITYKIKSDIAGDNLVWNIALNFKF